MEQCVEIPSGEVGAADGAAKQHVADKGHLARLVIKHYVTGSVAGAVVDVEDDLAECHGVAVLQPALRRKYAPWGLVEHLALLGQQVDPECVVPVGAFDGECPLLGQCCRSASMVDVGVGNEDFCQLNALPVRCGCYGVQIAAGVDDCADAGLVTPRDGAVLLEGRDRNSGEFHDCCASAGGLSGYALAEGLLCCFLAIIPIFVPAMCFNPQSFMAASTIPSSRPFSVSE